MTFLISLSNHILSLRTKLCCMHVGLIEGLIILMSNMVEGPYQDARFLWSFGAILVLPL